ncbi:MAG: tetratricopeptide repeat protein [bacterium]|nr:tetratricopeptide repeat protein [bacterium]
MRGDVFSRRRPLEFSFSAELGAGAQPDPARGLATARELHLQGRYDEALDRLQDLLGDAASTPEAADRTRAAALLRAWCLIEHKDHDGALAWLDTAVAHKLLAADELQVRILRWHVDLFQERYESVEQGVIEALSRVADTPTVEHAELRLLLGAALRWRGRLQDALSHVEYACSAFTVLAEPGRCAVATNFLGWTCVSLGRFEEARRWFEKALALNDGLGARLRVAQNYQNLAIVCYKQGDYATAVELLEQEIATVGERCDMLARARIALGNVRRLQGLYEEASRELHQGWRHAVDAELSREQALALEFLGDVQRDAGLPAEARTYYARSMKIAGRLAPRGDLVMELRRREGECFDLEGRHEEALAVLDDARALCTEVGDDYEAAVTRRCRAENAANLGRWSHAQDLADRAVADLESLRARHERMVAAHTAARLRLRRLDSDTTTSSTRNRRLLDEAWNHALVAHRLDTDLEGTPLREGIAATVAELARRRLPDGPPPPQPGTVFSARRAPATRIVAASPAMREVLRRCDGFARYDGPVLVMGETGSGKELLAQRLHEHGPRTGGPFRRLDCAAAPPGDLARELFGSGDDGGMLERAAGGTLLLTRIDRLEDALQERLLAAVRDGVWRPVGAADDHDLDVRLVATVETVPSDPTPMDRLRPDLYFRLRLMTVAVPPLRERAADVMALMEHFLTRLEGSSLAPREILDPTSLQAVAEHDWPGNAAEVESLAQGLWLRRLQGRPAAVRRQAAGGRSELLFAGQATATAGSTAGMSWDALHGMLTRAAGNKSRVARQLGVSRGTLYRWLDALDPGRAAGADRPPA